MSLRIEREEFVNKTFRINKRLVDAMDKVCEEKGISMNKLVDIFIRYSLENLEDPAERTSRHPAK